MPRSRDVDNTREQKNRIADAAVALFVKKTYDRTSLNEIISQSRMAKGTFYHYFRNKEEIIDFLARQIAVAVLPDLEELVADPDLDALSKLKRCFRIIKTYKLKNRRRLMLVASLMYRDENLFIRYRINQVSSGMFAPIFSRILRQGKKEGIFDISDPDDTAELLMQMSIGMGEILIPLALDLRRRPQDLWQIGRKILVYKKAYKRVLGLKKGELDIFDQASLKKIMGLSEK